MIGVVLTSNLRYVEAPGNVLLPASATGLPKDSVANVSQVVTIDEDYLTERTGRIAPALMKRIDAGLALVLDLGG